MKKMKWVTFLFLFFSGNVFAGTPDGYQWTNNDLNISVEVPPAIINILNSQGQTTGSDFSMSVNSNGTQGNGLDSGLNQIPLSRVWQNNDSAFDGTDYENKPNTVWSIDVYDGQPQTYTVNVKGIATGIVKIDASGLYRGKENESIETIFNFLISPGQTRQVSLTFNPTQKTISTQPIVGNGDLLSDIKSACAQDLIQKWACDFLEDKAQRIQKALDNHHNEKSTRVSL